MNTSPRTRRRRPRSLSGQGHALGLLIAGFLGLGMLYVGFRIGRTSERSGDASRSQSVAPDPRPDPRELARSLEEPDPRQRVPQRGSEPDATAHRAVDERVNAALPAAEVTDGDRRRNVEQRMGRLRELRRGEDPVARLALAREILAEDDAGPLIVHALQTLAELDPTSAADEVRRRIDLEGARPGGDGMMAMVIGMISANEEALSSADLSGFYEQGDRNVQLAAAQAMRARGDESLAQRFQDQCKVDLASDDALVRADALRQLTSSRSEGSVPLILPLLGDPDEQVRMQALRSLSQTRPTPEVLENIRGLLDDPSETVQRSAQRMLVNLERRSEMRQR